MTFARRASYRHPPVRAGGGTRRSRTFAVCFIQGM